MKTELDFMEIWLMKKLVPENARPARLHLGLLMWRVIIDVEEAGPVPVLRGLFCYYPFVFRGLLSVPVVFFFWFHPILYLWFSWY